MATTAGPQAPTRSISGRSRSPFARSLDLVELMAIFRRRLWLFAAIVVLVTAAAIVATLLVKPRYTAVAEVKIDATERSALDLKAGPNSERSASFVDTEIQVAKSRKVAEAVVKRLNLLADPEFNRPATKGASTESDALALEHTVDAALSGLSVARNGSTYLMEVKYTSLNPGKSAQMANVFAQEYIASSAKLRMETMKAQADTLQSGLQKLEQEAKSADQAAAAYRAATGLVTASSGATVIQQQATTIAGQLSSAEADLATARSNLSAARQQIQSGGTDSVGSVLASAVIQDLRRQRADVIRKQADIANRYGPRHPSYVQVQQELENLDRLIADESQRVLASLQATANAGEARVASLRNTLAGLQGQLNSSSRAEAAAQSLDREAQAKNNLYNQYNQAEQQASQQKNLSEPQGVIVSTATTPPAPSFPNKPLFGVMGSVLGVIMGACVVLVAEAFDSGVLGGQDVEDVLGHPFLGSIPLLSSRALRRAGKTVSPENYVIAKPMSAFAESFRALRSALVLSNVDHPTQVIALTSALPGEGKTASTLAFARVLGMGGAKVIVLDCDVRRSSLGRLTRVSRAEGLVEVLSGNAALADAVVPDEVENVSLLPLSKAAFTPRDLFGSQAFAQLLDNLRGQYDFIVLDTPPVLAVADARALASKADNVVFLCRWARTPRAAAAAALALLEQDGARVAGVALNMVDLSAKASLSVGDSSYYYSDYRRYYEG